MSWSAAIGCLVLSLHQAAYGASLEPIGLPGATCWVDRANDRSAYIVVACDSPAGPICLPVGTHTILPALRCIPGVVHSPVCPAMVLP